MSTFWVFAYGSLMWAPDFAVAERAPAQIRGWHRRFSLLSPRSWGSPDCPGLCAALHEGGACAGLALRVEAADAAKARACLKRREAAYRFQLVRAETREGRSLAALTFVWDPAEPRFLSDLTNSGAAAMIRAAERGRMGRSKDYLARTIEVLEAAGFSAAPERMLLAAVQRPPDNGAASGTSPTKKPRS